MKNIRINLEVSKEYRLRLQQLQAETGATSQSEIFRKAIATLETLAKINSRGGKLISKYPDGTTETLIFLS